MKQLKINVISLGCVKNFVDTECLLGAFVEQGWLIAERPRGADVMLINTCGFIESARSETTDIVNEAIKLKEAGYIKAIVVMGCAVQLMREKLSAMFPAVDAWVGIAEPGIVIEACEKAAAGEGKSQLLIPDPSVRNLETGPRLRATPRHYAYIKISEGCDNRCSYCLIPDIRGPMRSRKPGDIIKEAKDLIADGARELIVIAQDTSNYGRDLAGKPILADLLRQLRDLEGLGWLRLLYAHPAHFSDELIQLFAEGGKILPYIDLPIQHASDKILKSMGRGIDQAGIRKLVAKIRAAVPNAAIRTSIIVGYPGETEEDFNELLAFIREIKFERLGAFAYSPEENTPAAKLDGQLSKEVKDARLLKLMELQHQIATERSYELIDKEVDVIVDGRGHSGEWVGRTIHDTPDADGTIMFEEAEVAAGTIARARVTDGYGYDLTGQITNIIMPVED